MAQYNTDYELLLQQVTGLTYGETDWVANMANVSAAIFNQVEGLNWVGFYRVVDGELVLGPFQGQVACIRIPFDKGVCGAAARTGEIQRIDDVHQFEGHIACDAASNSEIVLPIKVDGEVVAVLDIDSPEFSRFSQADQDGLAPIAQLLSQLANQSAAN
ncbi:GAF domain-containing protein [Paraferrimonas sedimenticola]|uniref:GAF domain-containing protein n=1 Tax=Paraferrimonas sedimenticola TaxID=375674 RepID=A0AA37RZ78_9GAMM|nr:GAF domain-containing protein [Paraferrimonas sedimenticola]GLP98074.1 hypothetical protein GCM10007895_33810 [Paraferrimonas sedimenticola]